MDYPKRGAYKRIYSLNDWRPKDISNAHTHQDYGDKNAAHIILLGGRRILLIICRQITRQALNSAIIEF